MEFHCRRKSRRNLLFAQQNGTYLPHIIKWARKLQCYGLYPILVLLLVLALFAVHGVIFHCRLCWWRSCSNRASASEQQCFHALRCKNPFFFSIFYSIVIERKHVTWQCTQGANKTHTHTAEQQCSTENGIIIIAKLNALWIKWNEMWTKKAIRMNALSFKWINT